MVLSPFLYVRCFLPMALRRLCLWMWRLPVAVAFSCAGLFLLMPPALHAQAAYASDTVVPLPIPNLSGPNSVAIDGSGNLFIADTRNNAVKEALAASGYSSVIPWAADLRPQTASLLTPMEMSSSRILATMQSRRSLRPEDIARSLLSAADLPVLTASPWMPQATSSSRTRTTMR